ncbi:hypothetical protein LXL04_038846 [Taraxacum kok-saghyz]
MFFFQDLKRFKVGDPKTFHYLNQSNCFQIVGMDERKEYIATRNAMDVVGIHHKEQDAIFRVVAAILHLGNIEFTKRKEMDSSMPKDEKSWFHLKTAAKLFIVNYIYIFIIFYCRLVDRINTSIGQDPHSKYIIGVLDIYGFDAENGFSS